MGRPARDYAAVRGALEASILPDLKRAERLQPVADVLWEFLSPTGVSWVGFYVRYPGADEMLLEAMRDRPACSPIGLHGACGKACSERVSLVVTDVTKLGEGYIACDPRDRSEVVVPCVDGEGVCWGVLDLDSFDADAFDENDARELEAALRVCGLTTGDPVPIQIL